MQWNETKVDGKIVSTVRNDCQRLADQIRKGRVMTKALEHCRCTNCKYWQGDRTGEADRCEGFCDQIKSHVIAEFQDKGAKYFTLGEFSCGLWEDRDG